MSGARPDTWMPFYWGDYLRDTMHLELAEHGAYCMLIAHYWVQGGPLPDDDKRLARIARCGRDEWLEMRPTLQEFFKVEAGVWRHKRIDQELEKAAEKGRVASEKARKAARARHNNKNDVEQSREDASSTSTSNASSMPEDVPQTCHPPPQPHDSSLRSESRESPPDDVRAAFDLWNELARDIGHPVARELSRDRRAKIRQRLEQCDGLAGWRQALAKVRASSFCRGGRGWHIDLDSLLQRKTFTKLMEGSYDDRPSKDSRAPGDVERRRRLAAGASMAMEVPGRAPERSNGPGAERPGRGDEDADPGDTRPHQRSAGPTFFGPSDA